MRISRGIRAGVAALAAAIHLLVGAGAAPAAQEVERFPLAPGATPFGLINGDDGRLWYTEGDISAIGAITTSGVRSSYTTPTPGALPMGITQGPNGRIWFTEFSGQAVGSIALDGTGGVEYDVSAGAFGGTSNPESIITGPDGNMWFTENGNGTIGRISTAGAGFTRFSTGSPANTPSHIVVGPDGNLWIAEYDGNDIVRMAVDGSFTSFPLPDSGSAARGIAVGPDGNLWFTEFRRSRIGMITPAGVITEFALPSGGSGPWGITPGPDGEAAMYFAEWLGNRVGRIDTVTGAITEITVPDFGGDEARPIAVAFDADKRLWFAAWKGAYIGRFVAGVAPVVTATRSPSTPSGNAGWDRAPVRVTITGTDDRSSPVTIRCEQDRAAAPGAYSDLPSGACPFGAPGGADVTADGPRAVDYAGSDAAGNPSLPGRLTFRIDATPPVVSCAAGPSFVKGSAGQVTATVADPTSGPIAATLSGAADTTTAGKKTLSLTGEDVAGNTTIVACAYEVVLGACENGIDDDRDGFIDAKDPQCAKGRGKEDPVDNPIVACAKRQLVLVDVLLANRGRKVRLVGIADPDLAGRKVTIRQGARKVATATIATDGTFATRARAPRRKDRKRARYQAVLGRSKSLNLKLDRRVITSTARVSRGKVVFSGRVVGRRLKKRPMVELLARRQGCSNAGFVRVARARLGRDGRFKVTAGLLDDVDIAVYRVRTQARTGRRSVRTFSLPRPVKLR